MNRDLIYERVDIHEIESVFGVHFDICLDEFGRSYRIRVHKDIFYTQRHMSECEIMDMPYEALKQQMLTMAKSVFDDYCRSLI